MKPHSIASTIVLSILALSATWAQEKTIRKSKVPAMVLQSFAKTFPKAHANAFKSEKEKGATFYEIESVEGKSHRDVLFDAKGTIVEVEESVEMGQVPEAVTKAMKTDFPSGKTTKAEKTMHGQDVTYEFVIAEGTSKFEVSYAPDGKRLSKEEIKKDQEEEDED